jgi:hypothetical protein
MPTTAISPRVPWRTRIGNFIRAEWILILILNYAFLVGVIACVFFLFAEGKERYMETEPRLVWGVRGFVEIVFFVSQIGVALLAAVALHVARNHARHMAERTKEAERARRATVYMEINSRYHSPAITYSRLKLVYLTELYAAVARTETLDEFVDARLRVMWYQSFAKFDEAQSGECDYTRTLKLLSYLEDIGVLVEKEYVDANDVLDFMGGVILMVEKALRAHIIWRRQEEQDGSGSLYANALKLMHRAERFPSTTFNDGIYRVNLTTND